MLNLHPFTLFKNLSHHLSIVYYANHCYLISYKYFGCSDLEKIIVESDNPNYDSRENCNAIIETNNNTLITGCKNAIIPNSVTAISDMAFEGCSSLIELTISNSVTYIGYYAFSWCQNLTSVNIGNSVTTIGQGTFYGCNSLSTLYSHNTTPPTLDYSFDENHYTTVNVYVPQEALATYQSTNEWEKFLNMHAIDDISTTVTQPNAATDAETVTVYTLEGKGQTMKKADVQSLPKGIYIVDGKKVVVK